MMKTAEPPGPLSGLRILDLSTVIAGPLASTLLADLGAQVLKVEKPGEGDPLRGLPPYKNGAALWWKVTNRNKKGISLDLRTEEGREILGQLIGEFDVLVENFRPGTLDRWGITKEWLHAINPALIILRVTGFGQSGPYRNRPGFARVFEAMSGFTNLCGEAERPPVHVGFPVADSIGGLFGAIGILSALAWRHRNPAGSGLEIDCSMLEAMFRILDFLPIEYDQLGIVRQRSGNASQYASPGNVYRTADGKWASIAASTQSIFERLCRALGIEASIKDGRFLTNALRVENRSELDALIGQSIGRLSLEALRRTLDAHQVGFSPIYGIDDIFNDEHYAAREAIVKVEDAELGEVRMQGVVPRFCGLACAVGATGPGMGEHNEEIYAGLGIDPSRMDALRGKGVI